MSTTRTSAAPAAPSRPKSWRRADVGSDSEVASVASVSGDGLAGDMGAGGGTTTAAAAVADASAGGKGSGARGGGLTLGEGRAKSGAAAGAGEMVGAGTGAGVVAAMVVEEDEDDDEAGGGRLRDTESGLKRAGWPTSLTSWAGVAPAGISGPGWLYASSPACSSSSPLPLWLVDCLAKPGAALVRRPRGRADDGCFGGGRRALRPVNGDEEAVRSRLAGGSVSVMVATAEDEEGEEESCGRAILPCESTSLVMVLRVTGRREGGGAEGAAAEEEESDSESEL